MVRIRERPRWKQILLLEFMAVEHKREIVIEGYVFLLVILTSPLWCWYFLPAVLRFAREWGGHQLELYRRKTYGGIDVAECNTARPRLGWLRRRRSLSRLISLRQTDVEVRDSPLLRLPEEIRREIFLHLVCPAEELTICSMRKEKRLVAVPTSTWNNAHADASSTRQRWGKLLDFFNNGVTEVASRYDPYTCRDMLSLAKTNRRMYQEIIPMLYEENVFNFCPLHSQMHAGAVEHFLAFTHSIPAARLHDLRHVRLQLKLDFWYNEKQRTYCLLRGGEDYRWRRLCKALKQMRYLVTLHVLVARVQYRTRSRTWNRRQPVDGQTPENRVVRQLVGVRARRECVVEVPWLKHVVGDLPGAEFKLREMEGAIDPVDESLLLRR